MNEPKMFARTTNRLITCVIFAIYYLQEISSALQVAERLLLINLREMILIEIMRTLETQPLNNVKSRAPWMYEKKLNPYNVIHWSFNMISCQYRLVTKERLIHEINIRWNISLIASLCLLHRQEWIYQNHVLVYEGFLRKSINLNFFAV